MKTIVIIITKYVALSLFCIFPSILYALTIHTSDFIQDDDRAYFNGFEGLPDSPNTTMDYVYTEDNIRVEQIVNPNIYDQFPQIWVAGVPDGPEGNNAWYPNGGDYGYTMITMEDGGEFSNLGLLVGSGGGLQTTHVMFELFYQGNLVSSGNVDFLFDFQYLGFSDEIFDTLLLRDTRVDPSGVSFLDSNINTLSIDNIEVSSVPAPSALYLLGLGLMLLYGRPIHKLRI